MTSPDLREGYVRWLRRAAPTLALPLATTALVQAASTAAWWDDPVPAGGAMRYLFISVAVASVVVGRNIRTRDTASTPLDVAAMASLSWKLVVYAIAPVVIGAVLSIMTRQVWDYYAMLVVTLVGLWLLFPRYDQWVAWAATAEGSA
ncbi:MAG TPA: hypothetical protein DCP20_10510 [Coriobacteriia bacterium]|uniref:hypothetical protein n=1 Tax=Anaerosoma tenue TaxID=2933588 RepID=UPI00076D6425|nr:hypothetical protein [Anaerosoma tenue]KUK49175.1 MAG: hypothetical protein XD74_0211 [Actinobacteria bacterium 66_15]MCK8114719.1 hypothetical protein [Anaerosoma tenue]HAL31123.1 hypothetical protein [Coriobacteriia bacterium]